MIKICLLPIYRRSFEENENEKENALQEAISYSNSKRQLEFSITNILKRYRFSFNQVCGFIYVYVDNLLYLKIKRISHKGNVCLGAKYNFEKEELLLNKFILDIKPQAIINTIQTVIDKQKVKSKFYVDDEYLQTFALSKEFMNKLKIASKLFKRCQDREDFAKIYMLRLTNLDNKIDESSYNDFLDRQIQSKQSRVFPFVDYCNCEDPDITKIVIEDLMKLNSYFKDVKEDIKDILQKEFDDKVDQYCQRMKIDIEIFKNFSEIQKMKFIYCHYYNLYLKK